MLLVCYKLMQTARYLGRAYCPAPVQLFSCVGCWWRRGLAWLPWQLASFHVTWKPNRQPHEASYDIITCKRAGLRWTRRTRLVLQQLGEMLTNRHNRSIMTKRGIFSHRDQNVVHIVIRSEKATYHGRMAIRSRAAELAIGQSLVRVDVVEGGSF